MRNALKPALFWLLIFAALAVPGNSDAADQARQTINEPGFRPAGYFDPALVERLDSATVAVLPTIIRRAERTAHSFDSQQQIVAALNDMGIAASAKPRRIDLGPVRRPSQWEIFQFGARSVTEVLQEYETGTDFTLVMEILTIPANKAVFGIEVYLVDQQGRHMLSLLLNSHHTMFAEAGLVARNSSEDARNDMIRKATRTGLAAFAQQIDLLRDCLVLEVTPTLTAAGILHDFQAPLESGEDRYGISLGFSTFSDGKSPVSISRSDTHPPRPGEIDGNSVLKLEVDVKGWAGFVSLLANEEMDAWVPQDWSALDGFSFWLLGSGSGTGMYVHVFDNRSRCSRWDDAERYGFTFRDDVTGWRLVTVPFHEMTRAEVGNGAPDDGFNLTSVHGWGIGTLDTNGPQTFYVDDFRLWQNASQ
jgi:hypothetical protein